MYSVIVETCFNAEHQLTLADGSKEKRHNHNWKVTAVVTSETLNKMGLVVDFHRLKHLLENVVSRINGSQLEKTTFFQKNNSSAENVAKYIYEKLETMLPKSVKLKEITVTEEEGCTAKFGK